MKFQRLLVGGSCYFCYWPTCSLWRACFYLRGLNPCSWAPELAQLCCRCPSSHLGAAGRDARHNAEDTGSEWRETLCPMSSSKRLAPPKDPESPTACALPPSPPLRFFFFLICCCCRKRRVSTNDEGLWKAAPTCEERRRDRGRKRRLIRHLRCLAHMLASMHVY